MSQDAEVKEVKDQLENFRKDLEIVDEFVDKLNAININNSGQINSLLCHTSCILNIYKEACILYMEDILLKYEASCRLGHDPTLSEIQQFSLGLQPNLRAFLEYGDICDKLDEVILGTNYERTEEGRKVEVFRHLLKRKNLNIKVSHSSLPINPPMH